MHRIGPRTNQLIPPDFQRGLIYTVHPRLLAPLVPGEEYRILASTRIRLARHAQLPSYGTYSANCHGHRFFENVVEMANPYLATKPDPATYEFLSYDLAGLTDRFGSVVGTTFRSYPSYPQRYTQVLDPPSRGPRWTAAWSR